MSWGFKLSHAIKPRNAEQGTPKVEPKKRGRSDPGILFCLCDRLFRQREAGAAADGNGPVNALDAALRKALGAFYPVLDRVHLRDYKVRILDGNEATAARTRVVIDSAEGARTWSTMGSDTNIIAASAAALADSLEYAIWKSGAELRRRDERHFTAPAGAGGAR